MQWRKAIAALFLLVAPVISAQAESAPATPVVSRATLVEQGDPAVQDVHWVWRGGARIWVPGTPYPYGWGPRQYYGIPPAYYDGPPYYYGSFPYWRGGRGYWHRRWHRHW
jgi:hypothetical protein